MRALLDSQLPDQGQGLAIGDALANLVEGEVEAVPEVVGEPATVLLEKIEELNYSPGVACIALLNSLKKALVTSVSSRLSTSSRRSWVSSLQTLSMRWYRP